MGHFAEILSLWPVLHMQVRECRWPTLTYEIQSLGKLSHILEKLQANQIKLHQSSRERLKVLPVNSCNPFPKVIITSVISRICIMRIYYIFKFQVSLFCFGFLETSYVDQAGLGHVIILLPHYIWWCEWVLWHSTICNMLALCQFMETCNILHMAF